MIDLIFFMILNGSLHLVDVISTMFYINKCKKIIHNNYDLEMNYHRYFFKWFGLKKGTFLSLILSLSYIIFATGIIYIYNPVGNVFLSGILFGIAYYSYSINKSQDKIKKIFKIKYLDKQYFITYNYLQKVEKE